jgi:hypothetical protein
MTVLADDPGHARACEAMTRIAERTGDYMTLAMVLGRRADARRGMEKADALLKVAGSTKITWTISTRPRVATKPSSRSIRRTSAP